MDKGSEDLVFVDCSDWSSENQKEYDSIRKELNIWRTPIEQISSYKIKEYPDVNK
ncbi:MAG: hypothetical protein LBL71_00975 [Endomicrobium sp.]|jgi:hypothetical protein|nr:hypothetical protein [Endomicrobium sp.]